VAIKNPHFSGFLWQNRKLDITVLRLICCLDNGNSDATTRYRQAVLLKKDVIGDCILSRYSILHRGAIICALDRFLAIAGDQSVAFDEDFIPHALQQFGIPVLEVNPISWSSAGRSVAGVTPQADILRQHGMPTFRRIYAVGLTPGSIPRTGTGCAVLDFSADGQTVHFSADRSSEPVEMPLGEAIDAVVDLFQNRFGEASV
jgi:hypothetical protein